MSDKKILGNTGEKAATDFLIKNKLKIIEKNFKNRIGEIDIIAKDKEYLVFVEVKTRTGTGYGLPCQAVDARKQKVIGKVASMYLANNNLSNQCCRFDIIEVYSNCSKIEKITHIKDAFQPQIY